jgi:hypothetical protein
MPSRKNKEVPKRCRCQPSCGKVLVKRSRQRHYRRIKDKSLISRSETVSDSSSIPDASSDVEGALCLASSNDAEMLGPVASDTAISERAMSVGSQESYVGDNMDVNINFEEHDEPRSEPSSADGAESLLDFEDVTYEEEEEMEEFLTFEEQQQQLEDAVGAELEEQLHKARECV